MKQPVKSLSEMTDFNKKEYAKKIKDARKKVTDHLRLMQVCKQQAKPMPSFSASVKVFENMLEAFDISLDALHGTPIEMFPETTETKKNT
ncbi:hypothetical protein ACE193_15375 [Bernardetia sp. OM2101]|uniref:hypothetical protein n=1 Tax=Bernardetia sp. OM2101 TaxID=3344876 RepID=UPI0035D0B6FD